MSKIKRGVIVAVMAAGLAGATAGSASAATGQLVLRDTAGYQRVIDNPQVGCGQALPGFTHVTNRTNAPITVYDGPACQGQPVTVPPGAYTAVGLRHSFSVPW
ncbi:hypothetical protein [Nonomuraea insulae]|uniref:Secreted protein n=1 Tax=Nonomuraea insulae TaxID=1616787 RepID=A0ABW1D0D8_9ACTN